MKTLKRDDILPSGKYKNLKVSEVTKKDPQYIIKMHENDKTFYFDDEVLNNAYDIIINENFNDSCFDDFF